MSDLTKRENESVTDFTIRQLRWDFLNEIQKRIEARGDVDLSAIATEQVVGYRSGFRQAQNEIHRLIEDAKFEDNH